MKITKEDIFKRLDRRLNKSERLELACTYELNDYHFGLGLWIRNTWSNNTEITTLFSDDDSCIEATGMPVSVSLLNHRDIFSDKVIEEYQTYLRNKYKLTKYDILTPTSDLWNAMVCLDVDKCERLLRCYDIDADMLYDGFRGYKKDVIEFNPIKTIAKSWDLLIDDTHKDWLERNNRIKKLLSEKCGVDFCSIGEDDKPDRIVNKCLQDTFSHLVKELAEMKDFFKLRDIDRNLFVAVSMMEMNDAIRDMHDGANPTVKFLHDRSAKDLCKLNLDDEFTHLNHITSDDAPDNYPSTLMFADWIWTLMDSAAYNRMYKILCSTKTL